MAKEIDLEKVKALFEKDDIDAQIEAHLEIGVWLVEKLKAEKERIDERLQKINGN
jgi:hypothetical protein